MVISLVYSRQRVLDVSGGGLTLGMLSAEDAVLGRQQHQWLTSGDDCCVDILYS